MQVRRKKEEPFFLALSGGETAQQMFRLWTERFSGRIDWDTIRFYWVDERCVPPQDSESNYGHAHELLFGPLNILPAHIHRKGRIGVVSRSGTLTYEAVAQITDLGLGQSTAIGIGGDPINGLKHIDVLKLFNNDPETDAVVMIGEIGGSDEETAAEWVKNNMKKPVVGFIAGVTAPAGKRMGHAGAIISGGTGTAEGKLAVMEACGIRTTRNPSEIGSLLQSVLSSKKE